MPRSRGGCATCKKRHRKCDETSPSCIECQSQNLPCGGYDLVLRWGNGIASRGRLTGAITPAEPSPKLALPTSSQPDAPILATDKDIAMPDNPGNHEKIAYNPRSEPPSSDSSTHYWDSSRMQKRSEPIQPTQEIGNLSKGTKRNSMGYYGDHSQVRITGSPSDILDDEEPTATGCIDQDLSHLIPGANWSIKKKRDDYLLNEFFETTFLQVYSTRDGDELKSYVRQLAQDSEALTAILIAVHLYLSDPTTISELFEEYYTRGLRLFRQQLEWSNGIPKANVVCAGVFICTLNLFQGIPWTVHLDHMVRLYRLGSGNYVDNPILGEGVPHEIEWIAMMDLPTFVQGRPTSSLGLWTSQRRTQDSSPDGRRGGIEPISGLPRSLLDIFGYIDVDAAELAFMSWPGEVGEVPQCHLWEAYRLAGILMGRRWRRTRMKNTVNFPSASTSPGVEVLLAKLIATLDALCDTTLRPEYGHSLVINSLLYPYATARLEVAILKERQGWVKTLRRIADVGRPYRETENARLIHEMLDEALESGDDGYDVDQQARHKNVEITLF